MVTVFLAFVFGQDPSIKMMGLGMATAILVDATIVRMVLVPATMTLLGRAHWWLPAWLDHLLPQVSVDRVDTALDHAPGPAPGPSGRWQADAFRAAPPEGGHDLPGHALVPCACPR